MRALVYLFEMNRNAYSLSQFPGRKPSPLAQNTGMNLSLRNLFVACAMLGNLEMTKFDITQFNSAQLNFIC